MIITDVNVGDFLLNEKYKEVWKVTRPWKYNWEQSSWYCMVKEDRDEDKRSLILWERDIDVFRKISNDELFLIRMSG